MRSGMRFWFQASPGGGLPGLLAVWIGLTLLAAAVAAGCGTIGGYRPEATALPPDDGSLEAGGEAMPAEPSLVLVRDGEPACRIVVPAEASAVERRAAEILQRYIAQMSGAELPVVAETAAEEGGGPGSAVAAAPAEILVGRTARLKALGLTAAAAALPEDGFFIKTAGDALVIAGGGGQGAVYGACTLLETYLGCRKYSADVTVVPERRTIAVGAIDDAQVPVITHRELHYNDAFDPEYREWHKLDGHEDWGLFVHTFHDLVPPDKYFAEHPEYFSLVKGQRSAGAQLCLSNPDVFDIVVADLRRRMAERPEARIWSVSQNDTYDPCECEDCRAADEREDSHAGSLIAFVNRVAAEFPDKIIATLAYQYTRRAPRNVKPAANVVIVLCSIECDRSRPLAEHTGPDSFRRDLEEWSRISDNILIWDYVVQFTNYVSPFPNLRVLKPNIQLFVENGARMMFQQGCGRNKGELNELRTYLIAKLLWNPDADIDALTADFLGGYYGAAGEYIGKYIAVMHDALAESGEPLWIYGDPFQPSGGHLSPALIRQYNALFDLAEAFTAGDPATLARTRAARLPLDYAILEQGKRFGTGEGGLFELMKGKWRVRPDMRLRLHNFAERCKQAGITALREQGLTPEEYRVSIEKIFDAGLVEHKAQGKPVTLLTPASPKYAGGQAGALTDGLKGGPTHDCNWLGFEGDDMDAVIDLGMTSPIFSIRADFMQAVRSWIFLPEEVVFSTSDDGVSYREAAAARNQEPASTGGVFTRSFSAELSGTEARFVRVRAISLKTCPAWHGGAGGKAWIFADEIIIVE